MTDAELADALDGFCAWDSGMADSGIRDAALAKRVYAELTADKQYGQAPSRLDRMVVAMVHEITAPDAGYLVDDVCEFLRWVEEWLRDQERAERWPART